MSIILTIKMKTKSFKNNACIIYICYCNIKKKKQWKYNFLFGPFFKLNYK